MHVFEQDIPALWLVAVHMITAVGKRPDYMSEIVVHADGGVKTQFRLRWASRADTGKVLPPEFGRDLSPAIIKQAVGNDPDSTVRETPELPMRDVVHCWIGRAIKRVA